MTTTAMTMTVMPRSLLTRAISFCRGLGSSLVASSISAIEPTSVSIPVAVTTARPTPWTTEVPRNTMSVRSPSGMCSAKVVAVLVTGSLSPVSDASERRSAAAVSSRASAPTASPSLSTRMSPHTNSLDDTVRSAPSRSTVDVAAVIDCSALTAASALLSWTNPRMPLSTTIAEMTSASIGAPEAPSASQAAIEIATATSNR